MVRFAVGVVIGVTLIAPPCRSSTWVVTPDSTGDFVDIAAAVVWAEPGDVIELADGVFTGDGNRDVFVAGRELTLRSQSGNPSACILDLGGGEGLAHRAFAFQGTGPGFVLQDLTLQNGSALSAGESYGGAILLGNASSPTITGCVFRGNRAVRGGAIFAYDNCSPAITACEFLENTAESYGGAISLNAGCAPWITDCLFLGNGSDFYGGAFNVWNGATPTITNCTLYGNLAPDGGAAAWCRWGGAPSFVNTIIAGSPAGTAIGCSDAESGSTLTCCDVYGNAGGDWVDCIQGMETMDGNCCEDPLFCDPEQGDFRLQWGSPCLQAHSGCGQIGVYGPGACPSAAVETISWGRVKDRYR